MSAGSQHGMRPIRMTLEIGSVEIGDCKAEAVEIAAHVIERNQAVVSIESGVLKSFRHHRTCELLKLHDESQDRLLVGDVLASGNPGKKPLVEKIEDTEVGREAAQLGGCDRLGDVARIIFRNLG